MAKKRAAKRAKTVARRPRKGGDPRAEVAAQLVAADEIPDEQIAQRAGIGTTTLYRWKKAPRFVALVDAHRKAFRERVIARGIALRERRIDALNDRWLRMRRVIEARAADPDMADVPGGDTGLLVRQVKMIGVGRDAEKVEEFAVDTGLLREIREHEKQAAQELGQLPRKDEFDGLSDEELDARARAAGLVGGVPPARPPAPGPGRDGVG